MEWQPIETAPKGEVVLLRGVDKQRKQRTIVGFYISEGMHELKDHSRYNEGYHVKVDGKIFFPCGWVEIIGGGEELGYIPVDGIVLVEWAELE